MDDIRALLAPYAGLSHLECDGLTRVISHVLRRNGIAHTTWLGRITHLPTGTTFAPHFWVELADGRRVDFRARMWLGEHDDVPHGVSSPLVWPAVQYEGERVELDPMSESLFQILITPVA